MRGLSASGLKLFRIAGERDAVVKCTNSFIVINKPPTGTDYVQLIYGANINITAQHNYGSVSELKRSTWMLGRAVIRFDCIYQAKTFQVRRWCVTLTRIYLYVYFWNELLTVVANSTFYNVWNGLMGRMFWYLSNKFSVTRKIKQIRMSILTFQFWILTITRYNTESRRCRKNSDQDKSFTTP